MDIVSWQHSVIGLSDRKGFNDPGINTFTGNFEKYLAKESLQNSNDADIEEDGLPVIVTYERLKIKTEEFPNVHQFKDSLKSALNTWGDKREDRKFYENALLLLNQEFIDVMKIADYNTTGAAGDDDDNYSQWCSLVHATGATTKGGQKGGSYGIGKDANFASSALRTVFYTTVTSKDETEIAFIGRTKLSSFEQNGQMKSGNGAYGLNGQKSIRDRSMVPEFFQRDKRGTSIFIMGYKGTENNWKENLIVSVLEHFWPAIHEEKIIVKIDETTLNKSSLDKMLKIYCGTDNPKSPYYFYEAYTSEHSKSFQENLPHLGEVKLKIFLKEGLPRKIVNMRKTLMIIKEDTYLVSKLPFVGVFSCVNEKGNSILRKMEPPAHDDWDPYLDDWDSDFLDARGKKIEEEYKNWIRNCLRQLQPPESKEAQEIFELYKYLPDDSEFEEYKGDLGYLYKGEASHEETANQIPVESNFPEQKPSVIKEENSKLKNDDFGKELINKDGSKGNEGDAGTGGGDEDGSREHSGGNSNGDDNGTGGQGNENSKTSRAHKFDLRFRSFIIHNDKSVTTYAVIFKKQQIRKASVDLFYVGEDLKTPAEIIEVKSFDEKETIDFKENRILDLNLSENDDTKIKITFSGKFRNKLEIIGYDTN